MAVRDSGQLFFCSLIAALSSRKFAASSSMWGLILAQMTCASGLWADPPHHAEQGFIVVVQVLGVLFLIWDHSG